MSDSIDEENMHDGEEVEAAPSPDAGVVRVGKRDYAAGMIWNRSDEPKKLASKAKADAREHGLGLFALRRTSSQYGLASEASGHVKGMPVLADSLAHAVEGNFTGIFELGDDRYYLLAVQNSRILPGFDRLIHGRDLAYEQFADLLFQGSEWEHSFAPASFEIPKTIDQSLEQIIAGSKPRTVLQPVSPKAMLLKAAGLLALLGVAFIGWNQYEAWQDRQAQEEASRSEQAAQTARAAAKAKKDEEDAARQIELPPMPWFDKPHAVALMDACVKTINGAPLSVPGWKPTTLACWGSGTGAPGASSGQEGSVTMTLTRDGGTINWIAPFVNANIAKASVRVIGQNGTVNGAEVTWPVQGMASIPKFEHESKDANGKVIETKTPTVEAMRRYLTANSEESFLPVRLGDVPGLYVDTQGPDNKPLPVLVSRGLSFSYQVRHDPRDMSPMLEKLPVAVLGKVSLDLSNWTWTVEGVTYERIPLPADAKPYVKTQGRR